jgi:glycosyltransferase involved in cell wall biosynthesis
MNMFTDCYYIYYAVEKCIMPKISIGMPVYNGEKFIREALDSLLSQTFSDYELIISDNASTDGTEKICK